MAFHVRHYTIFAASRVALCGGFLPRRVNPASKPDASVDALYAEYEPGMKRYYTADAAGHAELVFSDDGVLANYYGLDSLAPCATFIIRG